jgi:hypothetical protein
MINLNPFLLEAATDIRTLLESDTHRLMMTNSREQHPRHGKPLDLLSHDFDPSIVGSVQLENM